MAYELYRKVKDVKDYFASWSGENLNSLTAELKSQIYERYLVKCKVFQRDGFKCQNVNCKTPKSLLTLHHIRFRKNSGGDKVRNGVTLCRPCHMAYHKGKRSLTFANADNIPSHVRGHTLKICKEEKSDWKTVKFELAKLRKSLRNEHGIVLSWKQIALLMKFLTVPYDEWDD